jgi:CRP-like cAMP-binding protein
MIERLKKFPIFSNLDDDELKAFSSIIKEKKFSPGERIFSEGDKGTELFVLEKGSIEIRKLIDIKSGREKVLATLREGNFFGEMALYSGEDRSATAYAIDDIVCFVINADDYHTLISNRPDLLSSISRSIIITLGERLRNTSRELVVLYETGKLAGSNKDADKLCDGLIAHLKESLKAEVALIAIYIPYANKIEVKSALGFRPEIKRLEINSGKGILGKAFSSHDTIIEDKFNDDDLELKTLILPEYDIKSLMAVPLISEKKEIGVLFLADTTPDFYKDKDINLMMGVSRQVATAIENAFFHLEEKARQEYKKHFISPNF